MMHDEWPAYPAGFPIWLSTLPYVIMDYYDVTEHDACAVDITELEWHVAYTGRHLERNRAKLNAAEVLNSSLKEDIEFVKDHW